MYEELYVIGAGGLGLEIAASLSHPFFNDKYTLRGFIDDKYPPAEVINGIPVQGGIDWLLEQKKSETTHLVASGCPSQPPYNHWRFLHPDARCNYQ